MTTINRTNKELNMYFLYANTTSNVIELFGFNFNFKEPISGVNLRDLLSSVFAEENVFDCRGNYVGDNSSDQDIINDELNLSFKEDLNTLGEYVYGTNSNTVINLLENKPIIINNEKWIPVGTIGNLNKTFNNEWKDLVEMEVGEVNIPNANDELTGYIKRKPNSYKNKIAREKYPFIVELYGHLGNESYTAFIPCAYAETVSYDEGDNTNSYNLALKRKSDVFFRNENFISEIMDYDNTKEIQVDYIMQTNTDIPIDIMPINETVAVVNKTNGSVYLYESNGSSWDLLPLNFKDKARIFSTKITETDEIMDYVNQHSFITIRDGEGGLPYSSGGYGVGFYGGQGNYVASRYSINDEENYVCKINMYNKIKRIFEGYSEE